MRKCLLGKGGVGDVDGPGVVRGTVTHSYLSLANDY